MAKDPPSRRERIVDAARASFITRGYHGTTIGDLAKELGISKAAIAYYFPTKDTFVAEFIAPLLDDLEAVAAEVEAMVEGHGGIITAEIQRDALDRYLSTITKHHRVAVWMDIDPAIQEMVQERLADINERTMRLVRGSGDGDRIRGLSALGGLWRPARSISTEDLIAHHDEIVDAALSSY